MDLKHLAKQIKSDEWIDLMAPVATDIVRLVPEEGIHKLLIESTGLTNSPIEMNIWFDIYWSASWVEAMRFGGVEPASTVVEIGAGIATNFIRAASGLLGSRGKYITVNINDILQTIVYEMSGQVTEEGDWFGEMLPGMIRLIHEAEESGEMEKSVKPRFLEIIGSCAKVLKSGSMMGFNSALIPITLRSGYTIEELSAYIPLARRWVSEGIGNLVEVKIPGFDTKWWLFFKKI